MSGWTFRLRQAPSLRVDLRGVTPLAVAALVQAELERLPLGYGNTLVPLGEFLDVHPRGDDALVFDADLARFDRVGWQLDGGRLVVEGGVGDYAGACMRSGQLDVHGNAGALAGCEMTGGAIVIGGDAGDFAASTLPGSMDGMRGGSLVVRGNAGARFADRMRRGVAVICGDAGDFLASRMVAGTVLLGGRAGAHVGFGMRRGSVVLAGAPPEIPATFVPAIGDASVFWQLLARDLAHHAKAFADLPARQIERHRGDLAAGGQGELIVVR